MAEPNEAAKVGRPTVFDGSVVQTILNYVRAGAYIETAAGAAGIDKATLHRWLKAGAKGEAPFAEFCAAVQKAMSEADMIDLARIDQAARGIEVIEKDAKTGKETRKWFLPPQWQAAAWRLERRHPKLYGRRNPDKVPDDPDDDPPDQQVDKGLVFNLPNGEQLGEADIDPAKAKWYDPPQAKRDV